MTESQFLESFDHWCSSFADVGVQLCTKPVADHSAILTPAENDFIAQAVSIRRNTFSTGRACAKSALNVLNVSPQTYRHGLLTREDGAVDWPEGVIGSLSHTNDWAVAAVARSGGSLASIGIDIEKIDRVKADVLRTIATEQEKTQIENNAHLRWARVALFSIKESVYKCLRPIYGDFIRFKDVQISELNRTPQFAQASTLNTPDVELFSPRVELLLPQLSACCEESKIETRLAVLPSHVLSFVSYSA